MATGIHYRFIKTSKKLEKRQQVSESSRFYNPFCSMLNTARKLYEKIIRGRLETKNEKKEGFFT